MKQIISAMIGVWMAVLGSAAAGQTTWVQIEAQPNLTAAQDRARAYADRLPDVNGFQLSSGWYAIALGPYTQEGAIARLRELRFQGAVPPDSFLVEQGVYTGQFWPVGASTLNAPPVATPETPQTPEAPAAETAEAPATEAPAAEAAPPEPQEPPEETPAQARASERQLTRQQRADIQIALQWYGYYTQRIDAAFGPGTRRAMQGWQADRGYDPTGILTTRQRAELTGEYETMLASIGLEPVRDEAAGIEMELPLAMVDFDRYDPPFAHYASKDDSGVRVLLISRRGDEASLLGLYDIMQTLEIVPLDGPRERQSNRFTLTGENDEITSYTYAVLDAGHVKGFTLIWPAGEDRRRELVLTAMRETFTPLGERVLPDAIGDARLEQSIDLLSGLQIRRPERTRSGFFVDRRGTVLTSADAVSGCGRVTIEEDYRATVVAVDADLGVALLRPEEPLAPLDFARFQPGIPRLQSEVAVSGYSYDGVLSAPTLTFGTLADLQGLGGEDALKRLVLAASPGDAGGPVFDTSGAVLGMLLPPEAGGDRRLPEDVSFAAKAAALATFVSDSGYSAAASDNDRTLAPEDLTRLAADLTVLISCWN